MFAAQEHFEKLGKEGMEAVLAAAGVQIGALQKLASLNLEATKAGFEAWSSNARIAERQLAETRFGAAQGGLADPKAAKKAA
jgi:hypothetical protein